MHIHTSTTYLFYKKNWGSGSVNPPTLFFLDQSGFFAIFGCLVYQINFRTNLSFFTKTCQDIDLNCVEFIDQLTFYNIE